MRFVHDGVVVSGRRPWYLASRGVDGGQARRTTVTSAGIAAAATKRIASLGRRARNSVVVNSPGLLNVNVFVLMIVGCGRVQRWALAHADGNAECADAYTAEYQRPSLFDAVDRGKDRTAASQPRPKASRV